MNTYKYNLDNKLFKIYINDSVHFMIDSSKIISCQSWIENQPIKEIINKFLFNIILYGKIKMWRKKYVIEFILEDEIITILEYDDKNKWTEILKLIDNIKK